jgi:hypothetical protein
MIQSCLCCEQVAKYIRHTQFAGSHLLCEEHAREDSKFMVDDSYTDWEVIG